MCKVAPSLPLNFIFFTENEEQKIDKERPRERANGQGEDEHKETQIIIKKKN